jgi:hypothetical protein
VERVVLLQKPRVVLLKYMNLSYTMCKPFNHAHICT